MNADQVDNRLGELIAEIHALESHVLEAGETQKFLALADIEVRLKSLIGDTTDLDASRNATASSFPKVAPVDVFAIYKGNRYQATLDHTRINGGRGRCVRLPDADDWLTVSAAAWKITETRVNGWLFWKYIDEHGSPNVVDVIRKKTELKIRLAAA